MTDQEFETFLAQALAELESKQDYLEQEFGLGSKDRFFVDYEKEHLQFFRNNQVVLTFAITAIGSHVPERSSWRWSWANGSLPEKVRTKAASVQQLYDLTGYDVFRQADAKVDESMAWEFIALSAKALGSLGAYSMPQRNLRVYVLLDQLVPQG